MTLATHLAAQLIVLPFFMEEFRHPGESGPKERALRWVMTVLVTLAAFVPTTDPGVVFFVLPVIAWGALRAPMREALWQLVVVATIASTLIQFDRGPFVDARHGRAAARPSSRAAPQQAFLLGCALVCLPFAMAVARSRQRATEVLSERERLRRVVSGATGIAIIETDEHGRITLFNPGAEALLGYTEEELLGRPAGHASTPARRSRSRPRSSGCPRRCEDVALLSARPRGRPAGLALHPQGRPDPHHVDDAGADDRRHRRRRRLPQHRRGHHRAGPRTAAPSRRRCRPSGARSPTSPRSIAPRTPSSPASATSCAPRSPTSSATSSCSSTVRTARPPTPSTRRSAGSTRNSHRLLDLIDDLLTLSSLESLDVELSKAPVDLREVIRRSSQRARRDASERGQRLEVEVPHDPVVVLGDEAAPRTDGLQPGHQRREVHPGRRPHHAAGALRGLRHARSRCRTPAWASPSRNARCCSTASTAPRTPRPRPSAAADSGLSIARSIAQLHGARISARSTPGQGSTFTVTFDEAGLGALALR